ncbi:MAG: hypothetical protein J3Q66DRAFT_358898 [Benniella sp.]|nr:MAG: hypothetical protein J3Q66DRAFT_358898 [Benniella sp.]
MSALLSRARAEQQAEDPRILPAVVSNRALSLSLLLVRSVLPFFFIIPPSPSSFSSFSSSSSHPTSFSFLSVFFLSHSLSSSYLVLCSSTVR